MTILQIPEVGNYNEPLRALSDEERRQIKDIVARLPYLEMLGGMTTEPAERADAGPSRPAD